jgi:hypothetical protein
VKSSRSEPSVWTVEGTDTSAVNMRELLGEVGTRREDGSDEEGGKKDDDSSASYAKRKRQIHLM